ncbi:MAG: diguanylate cyclase [Campylobacterota bacterium]|nr:diguanylate cyclase [Campylobacterota bacterium]
MGHSLEGTKILAQKIRVFIQESHFSIAGKITTSFGVGIYKENETKAEFFERVDKALYEAKKTGRNKVVEAV